MKTAKAIFKHLFGLLSNEPNDKMISEMKGFLHTTLINLNEIKESETEWFMRVTKNRIQTRWYQDKDEMNTKKPFKCCSAECPFLENMGTHCSLFNDKIPNKFEGKGIGTNFMRSGHCKRVFG